ncbi:MAG: aminotransferase class IV [Clostridia bacterium]|nr:aminotransferase class IV [Clostridia bacterium]
MSAYAYYNGHFMKKEDVKIPLTDRTVYFGDAIYDVVIGAGGRLHLGDEHIRRLLSGAKALGYNHGYTHDFILEIAEECIRRTGAESYLVYMQMSRSAPIRSHGAGVCDGVNLLVTVEQAPLPKKSGGIRLLSKEDKRYGFCNIKTVNLLPAVIYSTEAEALGYDETVLVRGGYVTECAHSNISILKDKLLYTHPLNNRILPGITRAELINVCHSLGIECRELPFTLPDLLLADDVIVTSTTKLVRRATELDGVKLKEGSSLFSKIEEVMFERLLCQLYKG